MALSIWRPALWYFSAVFALAFVMGTLRVTVLAPRIGPLAAVGVEVPLILGWSWLVAGRVLRRWPLPASGRLAMGALALAVLLAVELAMATALFGQDPAGFFAAWTTPEGALGLVGQLGFAAIPALRGLCTR